MFFLKGVMQGGSVNRFFKNAGFLSVLQIFNSVAPLFLLPYLTRVLPVEEFGAVMVALATILVSYVITDYGFSLSATYSIAKERGNKSCINRIISTVFTAKLMLIVIAVTVLFLVSILPAYYEYRYIFWVGTGAVIAQAYQPLWLFHGLEAMKGYTIYMVITKLIYVGLVLSVVDDEGDGIWVVLSWSLANMLGVVVALTMIRKMGYLIAWSGYSDAVFELKKTAQFFWARLAVSLYTFSSSVIVGLLGLQQAALYSSAEQGYKVGQAVTVSVNQAMYPYMAREKNWTAFYTVTILISAVVLFSSLVVGVYSEYFITLVYGESYIDSASVLRVMMATLFINYLGSAFGYPVMAAIGVTYWANRSVILGATLYVIVVFVLWVINSLDAYSMSIVVLLTEVVVFLIRLTVVIMFKIEKKIKYQL